MNLNNISLPYPVLGISDDISPLLPADCVSVSMEQDLRDYTFSINLKFQNEDIDRLIKEEKAEYTCEYSCARTMLRNCLKSDEPSFTITIPRRSINARLEFNCFVSVKSPISQYANSGFNDDYLGFTFDLEEGDILVAFPQFHYDADIKFDRLQTAGSFMQIRESNLHTEVFYDISGDKIDICLPTSHYQLYCHPKVKGAMEIIHSSLVMNALTYALQNIHNHENTMWARAIDTRLRTEDGFSIDELEDVSKIPSLAQRLLKDPYNRLFNHLILTSTPED